MYDESNSVVCNVPEALSSMRQTLFRNFYFYVTPGFIQPSTVSLKKMIESAGGIVENYIRSVNSVQKCIPNYYFIISCTQDLHLVNDYLQINFGIIFILFLK